MDGGNWHSQWDIMAGSTMESCCVYIVLRKITSQNTNLLHTTMKIRNLIFSKSYTGFLYNGCSKTPAEWCCVHMLESSAKIQRLLKVIVCHNLITNAETEQLYSKTNFICNFCENNLYFIITKNSRPISTILISLILIVTSYCFSWWCLDLDKIKWSPLYRFTQKQNHQWILYTSKNGQK